VVTRSTVRRRRIALGAAATVLVAAAFAPRAHDIHTTMTRLVVEPGGGAVVLTIRVFADDFLAAATGQVAATAAAAPTPGDSAAFAYVRRSVSLVGAAGRPAAAEWCGLRRTGEVLWLCVRLRGVAPTGAELVNRLLVDRHADQVNIVQTDYGTARTSLLFTLRADRKRLP
jgi:hypothetical protein